MQTRGWPDMDAVGLVLAGGRATRFGADKLAVELDSRPVLHHALAAVAAVTGRVMVSLALDAPRPVLPDVGRAVELVRDRSADLGPLAGLAAALEALGPVGPAARLLVVAGDAPFMPQPLLAGLLHALGDANAVVLTDGEAWRPLPFAVRPAAAAAAVRDRLDGRDRSLRGVLRALGPGIVGERAWRAWDPLGAWRADIDTPADLASSARKEWETT
jgi:molybdopterin-guanine dinucleotide biosynthesis protein A